MAAISITASAVLPSANAIIKSGIAGATITQGQALYSDSTDSYKLKLTTTATLAAATCVGLALNAASSGQKVDYVVSDPALVIGSTQLSGDDVWLFDATPGALTITQADLESGDYKVHLGTYTSTTTVNLNITIGGLIA